MHTDRTTEKTKAVPPEGVKGAMLVAFPDRVVLRLSGRDPAGMLDAVLTSGIPKDESTGAYALLLDAKGRIQTDLRVLKSGEDLLVVTQEAGAAAARAVLGRYAPFSRVKLTDTDLACLGVYGPETKSLLGRDLSEHESAPVELGGARVLAAGVEVPLRGFEVLCSASDAEGVAKHLAAESGAAPASIETYEAARISSGTPRFGADITPENFPAEANLEERAVDFRKGCYPGQETVARMHYRGSPNKRLHRFEIEGDKPSAGSPILQNEKEVGFLTSVSPLLVGGKTYALGYLKRRADREGSLVSGGAVLKVSDVGKE